MYSRANNNIHQALGTKRAVGAGAKGQIYTIDGVAYLNQLTGARKYFVGVVDVGKHGLLEKRLGNFLVSNSAALESCKNIRLGLSLKHGARADLIFGMWGD